MNKSVISGLIAALVLAACGGGGSGGVASTATSTSNSPTTYASVKATQGDTYTFTQTNTNITTGTSATFLVTRYYKTVNADGSLTYTNTIADPNYVGNTHTYDASGEISYANLNNVGTACTYAPSLNIASGPHFVGQVWDNSSVATCVTAGATTSFNVNNKGLFTAVEPITVGAGTFTSLKEVYTVTSTPTNTNTAATTKTDYTCWWDTVLGRTVKCDSTVTTTPVGSTTSSVTSKTTLDLTRYSASGFSGSSTDASVYAGGWYASFTGTDSGTCSTITISTSGTISGSCTSSTAGTFTISGSVNAQGSASFTQGATSGGATFSGQLNPITGSGAWTNSSGSHTGTWAITHK